MLENTNGVHFRAVWKNTAHVQGKRFSYECCILQYRTQMNTVYISYIIPRFGDNELIHIRIIVLFCQLDGKCSNMTIVDFYR